MIPRLLAVFLLLAQPLYAEDCAPDTVFVKGDFGQARFTVEIADDAEERAQGLMHRRAIGTGVPRRVEIDGQDHTRRATHGLAQLVAECGEKLSEIGKRHSVKTALKRTRRGGKRAAQVCSTNVQSDMMVPQRLAYVHWQT